MKTIKAIGRGIKLWFHVQRYRMMKSYRYNVEKRKYLGISIDIMNKYMEEHPKASKRMVKRHVERELKKIMKKKK